MSIPDTRPVRQTRQRTAIENHLESQVDFRTAQQIHDDLAQSGHRVGLATVYRTLQSMADGGEVDWLRTPEGEVAYRACSEEHHHHLVCKKCGFTIEIAADKIERWTHQIAEQHGFIETGHEIEIFGLCEDCSALKKRQ